MQRSGSLISLLAIVALGFFSSRLPARSLSAGQGKGGEVIAKPTPTPAPKTVPRPKSPVEKTKSLPAKFTNQYRMEFVQVPAGKFMMGSAEGNEDSEKPVHRVTIAQPYYMGRYEVTQRQWWAVMTTTVDQQRRKAEPSVTGLLPRMAGEGDTFPMYYVSWRDAHTFINRLNALNDGYLYRLPSEAEWEYACRAGGSGEQPSDLNMIAWYKTNSNDSVHEVGMKRPNAFGLYDMLGNVWEWCEDLTHENYDGAPSDGSVWAGTVTADSLAERRSRGASFFTGNRAFWKCSARGAETEDYRDFETGFRVAAEKQ